MNQSKQEAMAAAVRRVIVPKLIVEDLMLRWTREHTAAGQLFASRTSGLLETLRAYDGYASAAEVTRSERLHAYAAVDFQLLLSQLAGIKLPRFYLDMESVKEVTQGFEKNLTCRCGTCFNCRANGRGRSL